MAQLADALRQSPFVAAYMDTPDGDRILVARTLAQPHPGAAEQYTARIERGAALPEPLFDAATLDDLLARLRTLNRPGFTPDADTWMPTTSGTAVESSEWSVDAPSRGLSADDSAEGRHANDSEYAAAGLTGPESPPSRAPGAAVYQENRPPGVVGE